MTIMDNKSAIQQGPILGASPRLPGRRRARFMLWARRLKLAGRIEILLSVLAVISAIATYITMSQKAAPFDVASGKTMRVLLGINLALLLALGVAIGRWFIRLWISRKGMEAGSRLHTKVTGFFILIAIVPPIIMTVFSVLFLEYGIQSWFSEKVRFALNNSLEVAETYILEHRANIQKDMLRIAGSYNQLTPFQQRNEAELQRLADSALSARLLTEIMVIEDQDGGGRIMARALQNLALGSAQLDTELIERVRAGQTVIASDPENNRVVGIMRLSSFFKTSYLFVARDLSPNVLTYLQSTSTAVDDYKSLEGRRSDIQLQFNVIFIIIALLILMAAIWVGLWFASRLVTPLSNLVDAAERVGQGDYQARVPVVPTSDEVGTLSRAFNRMTDQLSSHQADLLAANIELDERRRFLEEVLEGVSAGVIGLQSDGTVFLPNSSASSLLGIGFDALIGQKIEDVVPEFSPLLQQAAETGRDDAKAQIQIDVAGETRTLLVRIIAERSESDDVSGYVVTFDDLSEQLADQRTAAWADVARRIAHEIKNPLTPIQLSAERLKRKYGRDISNDPAVFSQCTDTIIRQVGDLRRMVNEFSSFARMPAPMLKETDIKDMIKQAVFLQDVAAPDVQFSTSFDGNIKPIKCDDRLVGQALTNILKNSVESVGARLEQDVGEGKVSPEPGFVRVEVGQDGEKTTISVEDNGLGLPQEQKDRLMEPYVTTRVKGTGLGLAIVRRIMEDHGGTVRIADRELLGARAILVFSHLALEKRAEKHAEAHGEAAAAE